MDLLKEVAELSHEFGTTDYVRGGGGNTSVKDADTLWIKPSGTTLAGLEAAHFVALDRVRLNEIFVLDPPEDPAEREAKVKDLMMASVRPDSGGRPSVESPVHEAFSARFVVHTHPALVNGLACSRDGEKCCADLLSGAIWLPYVDPGYTLACAMRDAVKNGKKQSGREPAVVVVQNHGLFVAGDTADEIRPIYAEIMDTLRTAYRRAGISMDLQKGEAPAPAVVESVRRSIVAAWPEAPATIRVAAPFAVPCGPLSPDHIVYMKSYALGKSPEPETVDTFVKERGYLPRIVALPEAVAAVAETKKRADLALELAQDGALVCQLADAFGGVRTMSDAARDFIENWEVEAYRQKVTETQVTSAGGVEARSDDDEKRTRTD